MPNKTVNTVQEHRLTLPEVLKLLVADGIVAHGDAEALIADSRLRRIEAHHREVGKEMCEQISPGLGQLVEDERAAGDLREDCQEAGAG